MRDCEQLLPPANEVWGKVIFLHVCVILSMGGGGACMVAGGTCVVAGVYAWLGGGGMHGGGGACVIGGRGHHAWLLGVMHGWWGSVCGCRGLCMVVGGAWLWGGHAWLLGECIGYDEIRSMSGLYASYWNAFLFYIKCPVKYVDLTQ